MKVLIITGDGVNCELETARAFKMAGAETQILHVSDLTDASLIHDFQALALPGGFSFGDELGSGKVFSLKIKNFLQDALFDFVAQGKPIIGICNGFQVLTKLGLLSKPGEIGLAHNEGGHFIDQWATLKVTDEDCIWLKGIKEMHLPIRHGEGRFISNGHSVRKALEYLDNPNGSDDSIAGVTDESGLVLGLMPHPEAAIKEALYPGGVVTGSLGLQIFKNAVNYCKERF